MLLFAHAAGGVAKPRAVTLEASIDAMGHSTLAEIDLIERELIAGHLAAARSMLKGKQPAAGTRHTRGGTRRLNAAGLLALLEGRPGQALVVLREAVAQPFGDAHLAAHKNLYWAVYLDPSAANDNDQIDAAWSGVITAFERSQARPAVGLSIFDVGMQERICSHQMYDRNRNRGRPTDEARRWRDEYLELVKKSITDYLHRDLRAEFASSGEEATAVCDEDPERCESDWQIGQGAGRVDGPYAQKKLGGLVHIQLLMEDLLGLSPGGEGGVEGDVIEAGCFTGATAVFMRALLEQEPAPPPQPSSLPPSPPPRRLFVADSFEGIPQPRTARGLRIDGPDVAHGSAAWPERYSAGQAQVRSTFRRYGLLDERVVLVPGFFNVSLVRAPVAAATLALAHIDADAYESVLDALAALHPRLAPGGHMIIDDYHLPGVRQAVHEYRERHGVRAPIWPVPTDYVTTCARAAGGAHQNHPLTDFQVEPLTAVYWTTAKVRGLEV